MGKYILPLYQQRQHIILQPGMGEEVHYSPLRKSTTTNPSHGSVLTMEI